MRQQDVTIAKNYLHQPEIEELNEIVVMYLDYAENQAKRRKTMTMAEWEQKLDAFGHVRLGGIGEDLAAKIEKRTGFETRVSVFGHIQRGGSPTAFDRVLGTRFGVKAVELIMDKKFGRMVALAGTKIIDVPLEDAVKTLKTVDMELYNIAKVFFE